MGKRTDSDECIIGTAWGVFTTRSCKPLADHDPALMTSMTWTPWRTGGIKVTVEDDKKVKVKKLMEAPMQKKSYLTGDLAGGPGSQTKCGRMRRAFRHACGAMPGHSASAMGRHHNLR